MPSIRQLIFFILIGLFIVFPMGCGANKSSDLPDNKIIVTTSISPLADLIQKVGGDKIEVINLVPNGSDPHDYEPRPEDIRHVAKSKIFFANGVGEEVYLKKLVENAGNNSLKTIILSDGLPIIGKSSKSPGNPHLWLDVKNAEYYVKKISENLINVSPDNKAYFESNASKYLSELNNLDDWIQTEINTVPPNLRKIVVFHDAWAYYAKRYGLTLVEPLLHSGQAEPSAQDYARLVNLIQQQQIRVIFSEVGFNPKLVKQLAVETGVKFVPNLYDDTLGNTADSNNYISMMKFNTNLIVTSLK